MNIRDNVEGVLEIRTDANDRYSLIKKFEEVEDNQYSLKASEGLYITDLYSSEIYELYDSIDIDEHKHKFIFTIVKDKNRQEMIKGL